MRATSWENALAIELDTSGHFYNPDARGALELSRAVKIAARRDVVLDADESKDEEYVSMDVQHLQVHVAEEWDEIAFERTAASVRMRLRAAGICTQC